MSSIRNENTTRVLQKKSVHKSLLGPLPHCAFGPKAVTSGDITRDSTLKLENQKLTWSRAPENILIIKRFGNDNNNLFISLTSWLINEKKLIVYVEASLLKEPAFLTNADFHKSFSQLKPFKCKSNTTSKRSSIDLILTIGGDGTLLYAASLFQSSMPPVVAFNCGSLGFLTAHDLNDFKDTVETVLSGNASLMLRSRLKCQLVSKSAIDVNLCDVDNGCSSECKDDPNSFLVLNEVVINRGASQSLCNIDLYLENMHITTVQGDGLIVSTPTGSTAYAVAAGASMVHPFVPSIMITPICPHSLSFRPVVIPAGAELRVVVSDKARGKACISFDGQCSIEVGKGDYVTVRTSIYPAPCVCKKNPFDDWFDSLSQCLLWNSRQVQKSLNTTMQQSVS